VWLRSLGSLPLAFDAGRAEAALSAL